MSRLRYFKLLQEFVSLDIPNEDKLCGGMGTLRLREEFKDSGYRLRLWEGTRGGLGLWEGTKRGLGLQEGTRGGLKLREGTRTRGGLGLWERGIGILGRGELEYDKDLFELW